MNSTIKNKEIEKLKDLIKDIKFAMLTTVAEDGSLRSRPMTTLQVGTDDELWFFTGDPSSIVSEVQTDQHVNLAYSQPEAHRYVSVSGRASISRDKQKMAELWNPAFRAWFPEGLQDPHLALLQVRAESAQYWESPSGPVVYLIGLAKSIVTGHKADVGASHKLRLAPEL